MTVTTINAIVTHVMLVTELNWLLSFDPLTGVPGRAIQLDCNPQQRNEDKNSAINRDFRQRVSAVMEDLWHRRRLSESGASQPTNLSNN